MLKAWVKDVRNRIASFQLVPGPEMAPVSVVWPL